MGQWDSEAFVYCLAGVAYQNVSHISNDVHMKVGRENGMDPLKIILTPSSMEADDVIYQ